MAASSWYDFVPPAFIQAIRPISTVGLGTSVAAVLGVLGCLFTIAYIVRIVFARVSHGTTNTGLSSGGKPASLADVSINHGEFLPAALEMLLTPPSPVAVAIMSTISAAAIGAVGWSYFGTLDIYAVAPGKVQPIGRSKIIQPLEAGRIVAIHVQNGTFVEEGTLLLELDATETIADRTAEAVDLEGLKGEIARLNATVEAAARNFEPVAIDFPSDLGVRVRDREIAVMRGELLKLRATISSFNAQIEEKRMSKARLIASIDARAQSIALAKERVTMRETLDQRGAGSRALIIEAEQQLHSLMTTDASERGQLAEIDAGIDVLVQRIEQSKAEFGASALQKLVESERKFSRGSQALVKASSRAERTRFVSPISGTVQELEVNTLGQVVTTGQALMRIVPDDSPIEVECLVSNKDIGFVQTGQMADVKIDAFPHTRYGVIRGEVIKLSREAVAIRDASNDQGQGQLQAKGTSAMTGGSLVFSATLRMEANSIDVDGKDVPLSPGMTVVADIRTGERRIIDFLLSPLREAAGQAGHER